MDLHFFLKSFVKNEILMPLDLKKTYNQPKQNQQTNKKTRTKNLLRICHSLNLNTSKKCLKSSSANTPDWASYQQHL